MPISEEMQKLWDEWDHAGAGVVIGVIANSPDPGQYCDRVAAVEQRLEVARKAIYAAIEKLEQERDELKKRLDDFDTDCPPPKVWADAALGRLVRQDLATYGTCKSVKHSCGCHHALTALQEIAKDAK